MKFFFRRQVCDFPPMAYWILYRYREYAAENCMTLTIRISFSMQVVRVDDDSIADVGSDVGACDNLDVVSIDAFAFGFELSSGQALCAAFNPCKHLYAFSQTGLLPAFTIAKIITFELDAAGFSLERGGLVHTSANKMWSGGDDADYLDVPGHVYLAGTGSVGIKVSPKVSATINLEAELIIDADLNENGFFQPLGETTTYDEDAQVEVVAAEQVRSWTVWKWARSTSAPAAANKFEPF